MRLVPSHPRTPVAAAAAVAASLLLAGCGGSDEAPPFATPKGESKAAASLGIPVVATRNTTRTATDDPVDAAAAVARAAFPGGSDASRARAVTIVDKADWRTALAATAMVAPPLSAPLLFSDGTELPAASHEAIRALEPLGAADAENAQAFLVGKVGRPDGVRTDTLEGANPFELARAIDRYTTRARRRTSDRVVVVSADRPEYALPAAAWVAKTGDPVAFVTKDGVPPATARQLAAHPGTKLYVLGPSAVISPRVTKLLRRYGRVKRVGGTTPETNAINFAQYRDGSFGWFAVRPGRGFSIARTTDTLGAITLAPFATSGLHSPLLLTDSADALPVPLREYLRDVKPGYDPSDPDLGPSDVAKNRAWLTGDVSQISAKVQAQIDTLLEVAPVSVAPTGGDDGLPRGDEAAPAPTTTTPGGASTTSTGPTPAP